MRSTNVEIIQKTTFVYTTDTVETCKKKLYKVW